MRASVYGRAWFICVDLKRTAVARLFKRKKNVGPRAPGARVHLILLQFAQRRMIARRVKRTLEFCDFWVCRTILWYVT